MKPQIFYKTPGILFHFAHQVETIQDPIPHNHNSLGRRHHILRLHFPDIHQLLDWAIHQLDYRWICSLH